MNEDLEVKINLAIVFRGQAREIEQFLETIKHRLDDFVSIEVVHKAVSGSRLWIQESVDDDRRPPGRPLGPRHKE